MKRILSALLVCVLLVASVLTLASCSNATESYAKKINDAAAEDKHYTYDEVMEDLGDEAIDLTLSALGSHSGTIIAAKGCKNWDEIEDKIDAGEDVKGVVIVILGNKATKATYKVISKDDK